MVKRFGEAISYVWAWYSGQAKQVVRGQDLVGIVLRIGTEIIPLAAGLGLEARERSDLEAGAIIAGDGAAELLFC